MNPRRTGFQQVPRELTLVAKSPGTLRVRHRQSRGGLWKGLKQDFEGISSASKGINPLVARNVSLLALGPIMVGEVQGNGGEVWKQACRGAL